MLLAKPPGAAIALALAVETLALAVEKWSGPGTTLRGLRVRCEAVRENSGRQCYSEGVTEIADGPSVTDLPLDDEGAPLTQCCHTCFVCF